MQSKILLFGASGKQGTCCLESMLNHEKFSQVEKVRLFCRHSNDRLESLISRSRGKFELFTGNIADQSKVNEAMNGMQCCVLIQNPGEYNQDFNEGSRLELEYGKTVVDSAAQNNVSNFVLSSWASACSAKEVPHFQSKCKLETYLKEKESSFQNFNLVRPCWFMENLEWEEEFSNPIRNEQKLRLPLKANTNLPMCSAHDAGRALTECALDPSKLSHHNNIVEICGDVQKCEDMARMLNCQFEECRPQDLQNPAYQKMYEYLQTEPIRPDMEFCKTCIPNMKTFQQFCSQSSLMEKSRPQVGKEQAAAGVSRT
ncbi:hypothetical protein P9112_004259 [Eukaryota sp. TZLM1-RC]